jgi:hypothetical protein
VSQHHIKILFWILAALIILRCGNKSTNRSNQNSTDSSSLVTESIKPNTDTISEIKKLALANEALPLLRSVPDNLIIYDPVDDSTVVTFEEKCVVFANYSEKEFHDIARKSKSADEWESFYDDYAYYSNEASLFLHDKTTVNRVADKKYIRFVFLSGDVITIDRFKSVQTIFFFNPETEVKQCDFYGFNKEKYVGY